METNFSGCASVHDVIIPAALSAFQPPLLLPMLPPSRQLIILRGGGAVVRIQYIDLLSLKNNNNSRGKNASVVCGWVGYKFRIHHHRRHSFSQSSSSTSSSPCKYRRRLDYHFSSSAVSPPGTNYTNSVSVLFPVLN